jgi:hypothetical protein
MRVLFWPAPRYTASAPTLSNGCTHRDQCIVSANQKRESSRARPSSCGTR